MKRQEYESQLKHYRESGDLDFVRSMVQHFLREWDETQRELGYVTSLRDNLATVIREKVEIEIQLAETRQRLDHALRNATRKEDEDE